VLHTKEKMPSVVNIMNLFSSSITEDQNNLVCCSLFSRVSLIFLSLLIISGGIRCSTLEGFAITP